MAPTGREDPEQAREQRRVKGRDSAARPAGRPVGRGKPSSAVRHSIDPEKSTAPRAPRSRRSIAQREEVTGHTPVGVAGLQPGSRTSPTAASEADKRRGAQHNSAFVDRRGIATSSAIRFTPAVIRAMVASPVQRPPDGRRTGWHGLAAAAPRPSAATKMSEDQAGRVVSERRDANEHAATHRRVALRVPRLQPLSRAHRSSPRTSRRAGRCVGRCRPRRTARAPSDTPGGIAVAGPPFVDEGEKAFIASERTSRVGVFG